VVAFNHPDPEGPEICNSCQFGKKKGSEYSISKICHRRQLSSKMYKPTVTSQSILDRQTELVIRTVVTASYDHN
jgi:hypothetical protein